MATGQKKSLDLGALQDNMEKAAREYKAAKTTAQRAYDTLQKAEEAYNVSQKALAAGVGQLQAQTRVS